LSIVISRGINLFAICQSECFNRASPEIFRGVSAKSDPDHPRKCDSKANSRSGRYPCAFRAPLTPTERRILTGNSTENEIRIDDPLRRTSRHFTPSLLFSETRERQVRASTFRSILSPIDDEYPRVKCITHARRRERERERKIDRPIDLRRDVFASARLLQANGMKEET